MFVTRLPHAFVAQPSHSLVTAITSRPAKGHSVPGKENPQSSYALAYFIERIPSYRGLCFCGLAAQAQSEIPILTEKEVSDQPHAQRSCYVSADSIQRLSQNAMTKGQDGAS